MSDVALIDIFDPRGRVNRTGFVVIAAILVGAQCGVYGTKYATGVPLPPGIDVALDVLFTWLGVVAIARRLRDLDVSSGRLVLGIIASALLAVTVAFAVIFSMGEESVVPGALGYLIIAAAVALPPIAFAIWLHVAPGNEGSNRFGPAPGASGFSTLRKVEDRFSASGTA